MPRSLRHRAAGVLKACVATVGLAATMAPLLDAQNLVNGSSTIEIHQRSKRIRTGGGRADAPLEDVNTFTIKRGGKTHIVVADQNPLLFTYDATVTEAETEQYRLAAQFGGTLAAVLETLGMVGGKAPPGKLAVGGLPGESAPRVVVEGLDLAAFALDLGTVSQHLAALRSQIPLSLGTDRDIELLKETVGEWNVPTLASRVQEGFDRLRIIAQKCASNLPLGTGTGHVGCTDPMAGTGVRANGGTPTDRSGQVDANNPGTVKPSDRTDGAKSSGKPPRPLAGPPGSRNSAASNGSARSNDSIKSNGGTPGDAQTIQMFAALVYPMRSEIESSLQVLRNVATDVNALGTPRTLAERDYGLKRQTAEISIQPSRRYDAFLDAATKSRRDSAARKLSVVLEPYSPVTLGLAPAAVLLFIDNPSFTARQVGDAYTIDATDEDATLYNLAAMLTITPRGWDQPTFGGSLQLGVSPTRNRVGFYVGGGISVQDLFTIGGGVTWQQVDRLAKGLAEGQTIASPDLLQTDTRFTRGGYIHITVK